MKRYKDTKRYFSVLSAWLAVESSTAFAQAPGAPAGEPPSLLGAIADIAPMLLICYLIFWFFVMRPQDQKIKQHKTMLESLKKGDSVVLSSGIVGKVAGIEKEHLMLEVAQNIKVKVLLAHVARLEAEPNKA